LVAPKPVPRLTTEISVGAVVLVFVMVRFLDELPLFEPSIVTKLQPFSLKMLLLLDEPLTVVVWPLAGLIVTVSSRSSQSWR
jgi:hypothetical protein